MVLRLLARGFPSILTHPRKYTAPILERAPSTILEGHQEEFSPRIPPENTFPQKINQRKTIANSWVRCLENNQLVITSGFPTVNFRK